jgi:hypothetical protein
MFDIRVLPASQLGPDGQRLGEITIGDFIEQFVCHRHSIPVDEFEVLWRHELRRLISGERAVALIYDPRFAWIVYRIGMRCFVQEKLSLSGEFTDLEPRQTHSEVGEPISEWDTTLAEIRRYVGA